LTSLLTDWRPSGCGFIHKLTITDRYSRQSYITDISGENLTVKLYADDARIYSVIDHDGKIAELQKDLADLSHWCSKWQMKINVQKCSVLTLGHDCSNRLYPIENVSRCYYY